MRIAILSLSFLFFAATFVVLGAALMPAVFTYDPSPAGSETEPVDDVSATLQRSMKRMAGEQAASQASVAALQGAVSRLESQLTERQREALEVLAGEQEASQARVKTLQETVVRLESELAGKQAEVLEVLASEQEAGQARAEALQETVARLESELAGKQGEALEALAGEQEAGQARIKALQETVARLESELAGKQGKALEALAGEQEAGQAKVEALQRTVARLESELAGRQVEARKMAAAEQAVAREDIEAVEERPAGEGLLVAILGGGLFPSGQESFSPEIERAIAGIVPEIASRPDERILLEGHSDSMPLGGRLEEKYVDNRRLSLLRAEAVSALLVERGIPRERITVSGAGAGRPLATNGTTDGRAENRRVEVWLFPGPPPAEEGGESVKKETED